MDPMTIGLMAGGGAALGGLGSMFAGEPQGVDRDLLKWAEWKLSPEAVGNRFASMQQMYAPLVSQASQAAQVGANMDTQSIQANLARQGLGGTGLGAALGGGLRSGATLATNQLRAQLAAEAMNQSIGLQSQGASLIGSAAMAGVGTPPPPNMFQGMLMGAGAGLQGASLFGGGGGGNPAPFSNGGVPYRN